MAMQSISGPISTSIPASSLSIYSTSQSPVTHRQEQQHAQHTHHGRMPSKASTTSSSHVEPLLPIAASDLDLSFSFSEEASAMTSTNEPTTSHSPQPMEIPSIHNNRPSNRSHYSYTGSPPARKNEYERRELPPPPVAPPVSSHRSSRGRDRERRKGSRDLGAGWHEIDSSCWGFEERSPVEIKKSRRSAGVWDQQLDDLGLLGEVFDIWGNEGDINQFEEQIQQQQQQDRPAFPTRTTSLRGYRHIPGNHRAATTPPEQSTNQNQNSAKNLANYQQIKGTVEKVGAGTLRQQEHQNQQATKEVHGTPTFKTQESNKITPPMPAKSISCPPIPAQDPSREVFHHIYPQGTVSKKLPQIITYPSAPADASQRSSNSMTCPNMVFHKTSLSAASAQTHGSSLSNTSIDVPFVMMADGGVSPKATTIAETDYNLHCPSSEKNDENEKDRDSNRAIESGLGNGTFGPRKRAPPTILETHEECTDATDNRRDRIEGRQTTFHEGIATRATAAAFTSVRPPPPRVVNRPTPMNLSRGSRLRGHKHSNSITSQTSIDSDVAREVVKKADDDEGDVDRNGNTVELELEVQRMDNGDIHLLPSPSPTARNMRHGKRQGSEASSQAALSPRSPLKCPLQSPILTLEVPTSPLSPAVFIETEEQIAHEQEKQDLNTIVEASPRIGISPISEGAPSAGLTTGMGIDTPLTDFSGMMTPPPDHKEDNLLSVTGGLGNDVRPASVCSNGSIFDSYYFGGGDGKEGEGNRVEKGRAKEETEAIKQKVNHDNEALKPACEEGVSENSKEWEEEWRRIQAERKWDWDGHRESQQGHRQRDQRVIEERKEIETLVRLKEKHGRYEKRLNSNGNKEKGKGSPYVDCYSASSIGVSTEHLGSWGLEEELRKQMENEKEGGGNYGHLVEEDSASLPIGGETEGRTCMESLINVPPLFSDRITDYNQQVVPMEKWFSTELDLAFSVMKTAPSPPPTSTPVAPPPPPPTIEQAMSLPVIPRRALPGSPTTDYERRELEEKRTTVWPSFTIPEEQEDEPDLSVSPTTRVAVQGQFIKGNKALPRIPQEQHIITINTAPQALKSSPSAPVTPTTPGGSTTPKLGRSRSILDMFSSRNGARSPASTLGDRNLLSKRGGSLRIGTTMNEDFGSVNSNGANRVHSPKDSQRARITPIGIDPESPTNYFPKKTTNVVVTPTGEEIVTPFLDFPAHVSGATRSPFEEVGLKSASPVTSRTNQSWPDWMPLSPNGSIQNTPIIGEFSNHQRFGQASGDEEQNGELTSMASVKTISPLILHRASGEASFRDHDSEMTQTQPGLKRFASLSLRRTLSLMSRDKAGIGRSASSASMAAAARKRNLKEQISDPRLISGAVRGGMEMGLVDVGRQGQVSGAQGSSSTSPLSISGSGARKRRPREKLGDVTPGTLVIKTLTSQEAKGEDRDSIELVAAWAIGMGKEKVRGGRRDVGHRMRPRRIDQEFIEREKVKALYRKREAGGEGGMEEGWQCKECKRGPFPTMWICVDQFFDGDDDWDNNEGNMGTRKGGSSDDDQEEDYVHVSTLGLAGSNSNGSEGEAKLRRNRTVLRRKESVRTTVRSGNSGVGSLQRKPSILTTAPTTRGSESEEDAGRPCSYCLCRMCANNVMKDGRGELN